MVRMDERFDDLWERMTIVIVVSFKLGIFTDNFNLG